VPAIDTIQAISGTKRAFASGPRNCGAPVSAACWRFHPAQVDVINESFMPSLEEQAAAQESSSVRCKSRCGTIGYKGAMLDWPYLARAQALLHSPHADDGRDSGGRTDLGAYLRPGDHIVWGQACGEPTTLVEALIAQAAASAAFGVAATSFSGSWARRRRRG